MSLFVCCRAKRTNRASTKLDGSFAHLFLVAGQLLISLTGRADIISGFVVDVVERDQIDFFLKLLLWTLLKKGITKKLEEHPYIHSASSSSSPSFHVLLILTEQITILKPRNKLIADFFAVQKRRSTVFTTLKLWNVRLEFRLNCNYLFARKEKRKKRTNTYLFWTSTNLRLYMAC